LDEETVWRAPADGRRLGHDAAMARLAGARVVLLGETHDRAGDHRWQALAIAGLAALRPRLVVGLEMLPRGADPALGDWTAGRMGWAQFLEASRWAEIWGFDPALYRPILELCRDLRLPMRGLNIPRPLVSAIGREGWEAVPPAERGWLSPARPASPAYRSYLFEMTGGRRPDRAAQSPQDPAFDRFVRAQQAWDRAFACALAAALGGSGEGAVAVGVIGRGHLEYGRGVAFQLEDLGIGPVATALPGAPQGERDIADLVFESREP